MKILIIVPAYNEEMNILKTINSIYEYNKINKTNYDILVINDGSKDKTEEILEKNNINHIKLIQNLGIGGAVQTGYMYAFNNGYDIAVQFDGDGQHDITYVKKLISPIINKEANLVIGSRFIKTSEENFKSTWLRRIGINIISIVIKLKTKRKIYDTTSGFRAIDRTVMEEFVNYYPYEYPEPISTVNILFLGYKVKEIYVKMKAREGGKSSISSFKNAYYMINVIMSILFMKGKKK